MNITTEGVGGGSDRPHAYGIFSLGGEVFLSGSGEKTINAWRSGDKDVYTDYARGIFTDGDGDTKTAGSVIVDGCKLTIDTSQVGILAQQSSDNVTKYPEGGRIYLQNGADVTITSSKIAGSWYPYCGLYTSAKYHGTNEPDIIIHDSTLKIGHETAGMQNYQYTLGVCSDYNGIEIEDSTVTIVAGMAALDARNSGAELHVQLWCEHLWQDRCQFCDPECVY